MPKKSSEISSKSIGIIVSCIVLVAVAGLCLWWKKTTTEPLQNIPEQATIDIDPEEYHIPADEDVGLEIEDGIREYFYDVEGAEIRHMKTLTE